MQSTWEYTTRNLAGLGEEMKLKLWRLVKLSTASSLGSRAATITSANLKRSSAQESGRR
ncbi:hypothetical protein PAXRUDRAFT_825713 [Paxillus rubicundulus Ve08.2h10]|uniref:Uncharacterized protein n=1 Tax=Paxillus rubicundulus Ve08.2h10 TaxID=930991 RepID=A0A0D0E096_9AGAM|nr:hypothetical protein PAXRUDRAFT_825713 [Paxillus rubicundulus Ve08.2h10]